MLDNTVVESCHANEDGGGRFNFTGGHLTVKQSTIRYNTAQRDCGGICDYGAAVVVTGSVVLSNSAITRNVGGIGSIGTVMMTNTAIISNSTVGDGGGLYNNVSTSLSNVALGGNTAVDGAGIFSNGSLKLLSQSIPCLTGTVLVASDVACSANRLRASRAPEPERTARHQQPNHGDDERADG
jgi:hypothetical protein